MLSNRVYELLKWLGLIALPGVAWFIGTVGPEWGWANVDAIVKTINATGALIGILIGVSTMQYYGGGGNGGEDEL